MRDRRAAARRRAAHLPQVAALICDWGGDETGQALGWLHE